MSSVKRLRVKAKRKERGFKCTKALERSINKYLTHMWRQKKGAFLLKLTGGIFKDDFPYRYVEFKISDIHNTLTLKRWN